MISPSLSPHLSTTILPPSASSTSSLLWLMRSEHTGHPESLPIVRPIIGVPKESAEGEKRVAITPSAVSLLLRFNYSVLVEADAGKAAQFEDDEYLLHGATIVSKQEIWQSSDIIVKVQPPTLKEAGRMRPDSRLVAFMQAADNADVISFLHNEKNVTIFAMDQVPRNVSLTSRYFDAVYSQASIAGYRAVLEGVSQCDKFLTRATADPLYTTSEEVLQREGVRGVPPLKVLVLGGGISGIAAIKTARSLGADVTCYDDRSVLRPLVTSLGASFLTSSSPYQENGEVVEEVQRLLPSIDLIVCTIFPHTTSTPPRTPPRFLLRKKTLLSLMSSGGVVVDMTVTPESGRGNVEGAEPDVIVSVTDRIFRRKLKIVGFTDFPSRMAKTSSVLYANNVLNVLFALHPHRDLVKRTRLPTSEEVATSFIPTSSSSTSVYWMGDVAGAGPGDDVSIDKIIGTMKLPDPFREVQDAISRVKKTRATMTSSSSSPLRRERQEPRVSDVTQPIQSSDTSSTAYFYSYKNNTTNATSSLSSSTTSKEVEKTDSDENVRRVTSEKEKEIIILLPHPTPMTSSPDTSLSPPLNPTTTSITTATSLDDLPVTSESIPTPTSSTPPHMVNVTATSSSTPLPSLHLSRREEVEEVVKEETSVSQTTSPEATLPPSLPLPRKDRKSHMRGATSKAMKTRTTPITTRKKRKVVKEVEKKEVDVVFDEKSEVSQRLRIIDMDDNIQDEYSLLSSLSTTYTTTSDATPTVVPLITSEGNEVGNELEMDEEEYRYYYEDSDVDNESDDFDNDFDDEVVEEEGEEMAGMDPVRAMHTSLKRSSGEEEEVSEGLLRSFVTVTKLLIEFHTSLFRQLSSQIRQPRHRRRR